MRKYPAWVLCITLLFGTLSLPPLIGVNASPVFQQEGISTPSQLIDAVNGLRLSQGLTPLTVHPVLMQTAQGQADYMAATGQTTHQRPGGITYTQQLLILGFPLSGDLTLGGYRAENILNAPFPISWNEIYASWSDDLHLNTMLKPVYTSIGAGIAQDADGTYYYALDCAAMTSSGQMQSEASIMLTGVPGNNVSDNEQFGISQYMVPVLRTTARPDGDVIHKVQYGQTLWSLAIAYGTTINSIRTLNNLGEDITIYQGQILLIQKGATQPPPATSTPVSSPTFVSTNTPTAILAVAGFPTMTIQASATASPPEQTASSSSSSLWVGILVVFITIGGFMSAWLIRSPSVERPEGSSAKDD